MRIPIFALSMATSFCAFRSQMLTFVSLPFLLAERASATEPGGDRLPDDALAAGDRVRSRRWPARLSDHYLGRPARRHRARPDDGRAGAAGRDRRPHPAWPFDIAWRLALCGLGFGLFQSPNNKTIIPRPRPSAAAGQRHDRTARLFGQSGAAIAAVDLRSRQQPDIGAREPWSQAVLAKARAPRAEDRAAGLLLLGTRYWPSALDKASCCCWSSA